MKLSMQHLIMIMHKQTVFKEYQIPLLTRFSKATRFRPQKTRNLLHFTFFKSNQVQAPKDKKPFTFYIFQVLPRVKVLEP